ncbi:MAG: hypothetical protein ABSF99_04755, partial [Anaerolineales bacterium]
MSRLLVSVIACTACTVTQAQVCSRHTCENGVLPAPCAPVPAVLAQAGTGVPVEASPSHMWRLLRHPEGHRDDEKRLLRNSTCVIAKAGAFPACLSWPDRPGKQSPNSHGIASLA